MADEDAAGYRWESGYEKTWEAITEDKDGLLEQSVQDLIQKARRQRLAERNSRRCRLGMMRHLFIVLDMSACMNMQDLRPTRLRCCLKLIEQFSEEFFYLNPISQLGMIVTRDKRAEVVTELAGNPKKHRDNIRRMMGEGVGSCRGEPSLQNSLEVALQTLKHKPGHASREVLVIMGSLTTCDPGDVDSTIASCKAANVRCSVISLSAEVRIYRHLTKVTDGEFGVILDDCHLRDLLQAHLEPPPSAAAAEATLVKMGFPCHSGMSDSDSHSGLGLCMCHLDNASLTDSKLTKSGFLCPQCHAKYCELPVECRSCGLMLVSAPHLARSYHHLFPLPPFKEEPSSSSARSCFSCVRSLSGQTSYSCPSCKKIFCRECDLFVHETLHSCPGCASTHSSGPMASGQNGNGEDESVVT